MKIDYPDYLLQMEYNKQDSNIRPSYAFMAPSTKIKPQSYMYIKGASSEEKKQSEPRLL